MNKEPLNLTIEEHTKKNIIVRGDKETYGSIIKGMNGRWYKNLKGGGGWIVNVEHRKKLEALTSFDQIQKTAKDRKSQTVFKSSHSDSEDIFEYEESSDVEHVINYYSEYKKSPLSQDSESEEEEEENGENEEENNDLEH